MTRADFSGPLFTKFRSSSGEEALVSSTWMLRRDSWQRCHRMPNRTRSRVEVIAVNLSSKMGGTCPGSATVAMSSTANPHMAWQWSLQS